MIRTLLPRSVLSWNNLVNASRHRPTQPDSIQASVGPETRVARPTPTTLAIPVPCTLPSPSPSLAHTPGLPPLMAPWPTEDNTSMALYYNRHCTEIVPGLYLGSETVAMDRAVLQECGITHVVNTAYRESHERSNEALEERCPNYFPDQFNYLSLALNDVPSEHVAKHFANVIAFMKEGLKNDGGVFVHCKAGKSRSATFVIAYLMASEGLSLSDARAKVHGRRPVVAPNRGFEIQLAKSEAWLLQGAKDDKESN